MPPVSKGLQAVFLRFPVFLQLPAAITEAVAAVRSFDLVAVSASGVQNGPATTDSFFRMAVAVLRRCQKLKILWAIVESVTVSVMDVLALKKRPSQQSRHNDAMFAFPSMHARRNLDFSIGAGSAFNDASCPYGPAVFPSDQHGALTAPPVFTAMPRDESLVALDATLFPNLDWSQIAASARTRIGFAGSLAFSHSYNIPPSSEVANAPCFT